MNPHLLSLARLSHPAITVQLTPIDDEKNRSDDDQAFFEVVSGEGEVVGYVKAWHDPNDFAGFVHFDVDGNVLEWKVFNRYSEQTQLS